MRLLITLFSILFFKCLVSGQTISGIVVDEYQRSIADAIIVNRTSDDHTHSNERGEFTLEKCSIGDTLQVSFIGHQFRLIEVKDIKEKLIIILSERDIRLDEITISPQLDALNIISDIDIQTNPVNSSQDVLRKVPGLFIGQHAGGGKAEQIFLRGFDIDHGTDIGISVDGLPVNMVSHAHGQGYADLHFIIPETIENIDFGKGPYYENEGNFNIAGYVNFKTKNKLESSSIKLETGQFDTYRLLGMLNLVQDVKQNAYLATEFLSTDGYFDSPQNFNRTNFFGKYSNNIDASNTISMVASYFQSKWDASGQIPQRAVDTGMISRFGFIDDTEGGSTSRYNFMLNHTKLIDDISSIKSTFFFSQYNFELFSNFTFFLEDPINGDQIKQKENRVIYGLNSEYLRSYDKGSFEGNWKLGVELRNDQSQNNELSHTANRKETIDQIQLGDINETNLGAYLGNDLYIGKWTFNPSIRIDYFDFQYYDRLSPTYSTQSQTKAIGSPKFNILYNPSNHLQLYLKAGKGFHSNDTRVVLAGNAQEIIPGAWGIDIGNVWKPTPKMFFNLAYWYLYLEQEFVYVGDAGIVEPSGRTRRQGLELSYRYQPFNWLYWNLDTNYTYARSIDEQEGERFIPLAPDFTLASGLSFMFDSGLHGSLNVRHLANRPANENNSVVAEGYTITDLNLGYRLKNVGFGVHIQNLFNVEWNETQFATESRLQKETEAVEEIYFTPGTPFFVKGMIQFHF